MSKRLFLASGIIMVSLAFSATAFASDGAYRLRNFQTKLPAVLGTVSAVNGSSITLSTRKGEYTIDASNAKITKSDSRINVSDIANGDTLMVVGAVADNSVSATKIVDGVLKNTNFKADYYTGKVSLVSTTSLVMQSMGKRQPATETVLIDSNTVFTKDGQASSIRDIAPGQVIIVTGTKTGDKIAAASVSVGVNRAGTRIIGTVGSVSGDTISVKGTNGTIYTVNIAKAKTLGMDKNIAIGEKVVIFGSQASGTTNITATVIRGHRG